MTKVEVSDEEVQETAFAIGTLAAAAELFMEGILLNEEGERRLTSAMEIIEKYNITDEEIGIYVKELKKNNCSTTNFLRYKGTLK